jgi:hypothetical protein
VRELLVMAAAALVGCFGGDPGAPEDGGTTDATDATTCGFTCFDASDERPLAQQVKGQLDSVCGSVDGCHGGGADKNLGLSPTHDFTAIINVEAGEVPDMVYVKPFFPLESYLFLKVRCEGGIEGGCMPLGSPTDPARVALFHAWIEAGAPTQ